MSKYFSLSTLWPFRQSGDSSSNNNSKDCKNSSKQVDDDDAKIENEIFLILPRQRQRIFCKSNVCTAPQPSPQLPAAVTSHPYFISLPVSKFNTQTPLTSYQRTPSRSYGFLGFPASNFSPSIISSIRQDLRDTPKES